MTNQNPSPLHSNASVLKFVDAVTKLFDLTGTSDIVDCEDWVEVHPQNPPYNDLEYISAFVENLVDCLEKAGFTRYGMERVCRTMRCGSVEARIKNVDADPETGDPIMVTFREV